LLCPYKKGCKVTRCRRHTKGYVPEHNYDNTPSVHHSKEKTDVKISLYKDFYNNTPSDSLSARWIKAFRATNRAVKETIKADPIASKYFEHLMNGSDIDLMLDSGPHYDHVLEVHDRALLIDPEVQDLIIGVNRSKDFFLLKRWQVRGHFDAKNQKRQKLANIKRKKQQKAAILHKKRLKEQRIKTQSMNFQVNWYGGKFTPSKPSQTYETIESSIQEELNNQTHSKMLPTIHVTNADEFEDKDFIEYIKKEKMIVLCPNLISNEALIKRMARQGIVLFSSYDEAIKKIKSQSKKNKYARRRRLKKVNTESGKLYLDDSDDDNEKTFNIPKHVSRSHPSYEGPDEKSLEDFHWYKSYRYVTPELLRTLSMYEKSKLRKEISIHIEDMQKIVDLTPDNDIRETEIARLMNLNMDIYDVEREEKKSYIQELVGVSYSECNKIYRSIVEKVEASGKAATSWKSQLSSTFTMIMDVYLSSYRKWEHHIWSFLVYFAQVTRSKNVIDISLHTYQYLATLGIHIGPILHEKIDSFSELICRHFNPSVNTESGDGFLYGILTSDLVLNMQELFTHSIVSTYVPGIKDKIKTVFGKPKEKSFLAFMVSLSRMWDYISHGIQQIRLGVPVKDVLFGPSREQVLHLEVESLALRAEKTHRGRAVEGSTHCTVIVSQCRKLLDQINLCKASIVGPSRKRLALDTIYQKVISIQSSNEIRMKEGSRITPYAVVICGPPGIGKSNIPTLLMSFLCKIRGIDEEDTGGDVMQLCYSRNVNEDFWSGYDMNTHIGTFISEVGSKTANHVKQSGDEGIEGLVSLVDSIAKPLNQADLPSKGQVYFTSDLIMMDTNNEHLNLNLAVSNPAAVKRRFVFIEPIVTEKYRTPQGNLRKDANTDEVDEWWKFRVTKYNAASATDSTVIYNKILTTAEFTRFILNDMIQHYASQERVVDSRSKLGPLFLEKLRIENERGVLRPEETIANADISESKFHTEPRKNTFAERRAKRGVTESKGDPVTREALSEKIDNDLHMDLSTVSNGSYTYDSYYVMFMDFLLWLAQVMTILSHYVQKNRITFLISLVAFTTYFNITLSLMLSAIWFTGLWSVCLSIGKITLNRFISNASFFRAWKFQSWLFHKIPHKRLEPSNVFGKMFPDVPSKFFMVIATSMGALYAVYHVARKAYAYVDRKVPSTESSDTQTIEEEVGSMAAMPRVKTHQNTYNVMFDSHSIPTHKAPARDLVRAISKNVIQMEVRWTMGDGKNVNIKVHGVGLKGQKVLMPYHGIPVVKDSFTVIFHRIADPTKVYKVVVQNTKWYQCGEDTAIVELTCADRFRDITSHLMDNNPEVATTGLLCVCDESGEAAQVKVVRSMEILEGSLCPSGKIQRLTESWLTDFLHTSAGHCGLPLILNKGSGSYFAGIHSGSYNRNLTSIKQGTYAEILHKKDILKAMHKLDSEFTVATECSNALPIAKHIHRRSPFLWTTYHSIKWKGPLGGRLMLKKKSRLERTPYFEPLVAILSETTDDINQYGKPMLEPKNIGEEYVCPYKLAMAKMDKKHNPLNPGLLEYVVDEYVDHVCSHFEGRKLTPLLFKEAINGNCEDSFMRSMNLSTAGGFGFPGSKRSYFSDFDEIKGYEMTERLEKDVVKNILTYMQGESVCPIFKSTPKDEPRLIEKCQGKTRIFYASSLSNLIISRMFLLPLYTLMIENSSAFGTCLGIDMNKEAHKVVALMKGKNIMEGDYSGYDVNMPYDIAHGAASFVYKMLARLGYNNKALTIVKGILSDNLFVHLQIYDDVILVPGMQPSGKYATAEDNSIRGVIMLMYAYYTLQKSVVESFFKHVTPITYGDDLLAGVTNHAAKFFNNTTYQNFCKGAYQMGFTSASKSTTMSDFVSIYDMSLLKRTFTWNDEKGLIAKLQIDSIVRSLTWTLRSESISARHQAVEVVKGALMQLYFHMDEGSYTTFLNEASTAIRSKFNTQLQHDELPSYARLRVLFETEKNLEITFKYKGIYSRPEGHLKNAPFASDRIVARTESLFSKHQKTQKNQLMDYEMSLKRRLVEINNEIDDAKANTTIPGFALMQAIRTTPVGRKHTWMKKQLKLISMRESVENTLKSLRRRRLIIEHRTNHYMTESSMLTSSIQANSQHDTYENVVDVTANATHETSAGDTKYDSQGEGTTLSPSKFLERPVNIASIVIPLATEQYYSLNIWDLFLGTPSVRAKLRQSAFLRGNLKVRVSVSGTAFHSGTLLLSYQPFMPSNDIMQAHINNYTAQGDIYLPIFKAYLSQAIGATTMDVKANEPLVISVPYMSPKAVGRLFNEQDTVLSDTAAFEDFTGMGSLEIVTLNQVKSVSATPSAISVYVYAWMEDVQLGSATATQMTITTESGRCEDERKTGPIERMASNVVEVTSKLASVPVLGPLAKASTMAASSVGNIASILGWSKPTLIQAPQIVKNSGFQNGAHGIGYDTSKRITLDPKQELTVDVSALGDEKDPLLVASLGHREGYLTTFEWKNDSPVLSNPIFRSAVHPRLETYVTIPGTNPATLVQPTPMSFAALPAGWWRGDIEFRFQIVSSALHSGKLVVNEEPNLYQNVIISTDLDLNKQFTRVVDIQETQDFSIRVKWNFHRAWAEVEREPGYSSYGDTISAEIIKFCNGFISVTPLTRLQSPDDSDIQINVFVRCHDLKLNQLLGEDLPLISTLVYTESGELHTTTNDVEVYDINKSNATTDMLGRQFFGENFITYRAALKRFREVARSSANHVGRVGLLTKGRLYPKYIPVQNVVEDESNIYSYLRKAFVGMKGGMRFRIRYSGDMIQQTGDHSSTTITSPNATSYPGYVTTASTDTGPGQARDRGSVMHMTDSNAGIEFEVPFYSNNLFVLAFSQTSEDDEDMFEHVYSKGWDNLITAKANGDVFTCIDVAVGEDFTFMRFNGAPYYSDNLWVA
jgi:hypothetical protein